MPAGYCASVLQDGNLAAGLPAPARAGHVLATALATFEVAEHARASSHHFKLCNAMSCDYGIWSCPLHLMLLLGTSP